MSRLKPKSIATLDEIIANPKQSNTDAYIKTHPTVNRNSARATVAELLAKPSAQIYLQKHVSLAKEKIVSLTRDGKDEVAIRAAQDILDREYGKAKQSVEMHTTGVTLTIDLTSALTGVEEPTEPTSKP